MTARPTSFKSGFATVVEQGGAPAQALKDWLNGVWLGHPLHLALTDVPIGAWWIGLFLDLLGQPHKGGPPTGVFVQIVQDEVHDVSIPGEPYTFSVLKQAQAAGDAQALRSRGLPIFAWVLVARQMLVGKHSCGRSKLQPADGGG